MVTRNTDFIEFKKFHKLLMDSAPKDYCPFYFPVKKLGKDPDSFAIANRTSEDNPKKYSWKEPHAKLSYEEVIIRLKQGGNIGLSARKNDELNIIDIDDFDYIKETPSLGLVNISRRRTGRHHFSWMNPKDKQNITTEYGEMRSVDQYVVCAGSFVPTLVIDILEDVCETSISNKQLNIVLADKQKGLYTVHNNSEPPCWLTPDELPEFFRKQVIKDRHNIILKTKIVKTNLVLPKNHSALYDLTVADIVETMPKRRVGHPLHSSDTNANWSITDDGCLGMCWRHLVSLNAIQFLCVKAGYKTCKEAGVGHKGCSPSEIEGDIRAIWESWYEAKKSKLLPDKDPIPVKAMWWIALKHNLVEKVDLNKTMKKKTYNRVLKIINEEY